LRFTGVAASRRIRAVIIRRPAVGSASMIVRICVASTVSTTGVRDAPAGGGR